MGCRHYHRDRTGGRWEEWTWAEAVLCGSGGVVSGWIALRWRAYLCIRSFWANAGALRGLVGRGESDGFVASLCGWRVGVARAGGRMVPGGVQRVVV